jgi:hypothetical protein
VIVDWAAFFSVLVATLIAACGVVTVYSVGLRLLDSEVRLRRVAGISCFVVCAAAVLFGVYLVIPLFHR